MLPVNQLHLLCIVLGLTEVNFDGSVLRKRQVELYKLTSVLT